MKGSVRKRGKSWQGRVDVGVDPKTGERLIESVTRRTKREVEDEIADRVAKVRRGDYINPSKITFGEWLDKWYTIAIEGTKRPRTSERYRGIIEKHLKPALGGHVLQKLQSIRFGTFGWRLS